jgi:hypothetical protein
MVLTFWMGLRWMEVFDKDHSDKALLGMAYLLSLCVGIHLGTLIVVPGLLVLVLLTDWRTALKPKLLVIAAALFVLGVSVHLYLLIRANLNPYQRGLPKTWNDLWPGPETRPACLYILSEGRRSLCRNAPGLFRQPVHDGRQAGGWKYIRSFLLVAAPITTRCSTGGCSPRS